MAAIIAEGAQIHALPGFRKASAVSSRECRSSCVGERTLGDVAHVPRELGGSGDAL